MRDATCRLVSLFSLSLVGAIDILAVFPELVISYEVRNFEDDLVTKILSS